MHKDVFLTFLFHFLTKTGREEKNSQFHASWSLHNYLTPVDLDKH